MIAWMREHLRGLLIAFGVLLALVPGLGFFARRRQAKAIDAVIIEEHAEETAGDIARRKEMEARHAEIEARTTALVEAPAPTEDDAARLHESLQARIRRRS